MEFNKVKSFEEACELQGLNPETCLPDVSGMPKQHQQATIATAKLFIIADAVNGDWKADYSDYGQYKYLPYFTWDDPSGSGFSCGDYDSWNTLSSVGSRLVFCSREAAKHMGKTFTELYKAVHVYQAVV